MPIFAGSTEIDENLPNELVLRQKMKILMFIIHGKVVLVLN
jgi:hypothetical protein